MDKTSQLSYILYTPSLLLYLAKAIFIDYFKGFII